MPDLVVDDLRLLSSEALVLLSEHEAVEDEDLRNQVRAQAIVEHLPDLLRACANMGFSSATVMDLSDDDYEVADPDLGDDFCSPDWLRDHAALVYAHCQSVGLQTTVVSKHDIERGVICFAIQVSW